MLGKKLIFSDVGITLKMALPIQNMVYSCLSLPTKLMLSCTCHTFRVLQLFISSIKMTLGHMVGIYTYVYPAIIRSKLDIISRRMEPGITLPWRRDYDTGAVRGKFLK